MSTRIAAVCPKIDCAQDRLLPILQLQNIETRKGHGDVIVALSIILYILVGGQFR
jgi:hypothetical protein